MRRVSLFLCAALILVTCLANPVYASEVGSVGAVDLLGLGYIEANGSNVENMRVNLGSNPSGSIWFPVEFPFGLGEFELLVMTSDPNLTFKRSDNAVTYDKVQSLLGENYYVVRGNFSGRGKTLNYTSSGSSGDYFFILSAKAMPLNYGIVDIPFRFQVWDASNGELLDDGTYTEDAEYWDDPFYTDYDGILARQIRIYPDKEDLAGLDYFDLDLYFMNLEIDSISASFGGNALDVQYTETIINDGMMSDPVTEGVYERPYPVYKVVLRVDVSAINLLDGLPTVFITYTTNNYMDARPYVYVYGINAGKFWDSTAPEVTLLYRIYNSVVSGFSNVGTWFTNLGNKISNGFAENIAAINEGNRKVGVWLSNVMTTIQSGFTDNIASINEANRKVGVWLSNFITAMNDKFDYHFANLGIWITNQNTLLANKFNDQYNMLVRESGELEAAIRGDTAPGESFQDNVAGKDQQFDQMADVMESVTQPGLDSIDVSADQLVDSQVLGVSMAGLTSIIQPGSIFYTMIVMSIMMATASFVLFGKR